jgi:hypothetical protein
MGREGREHEAIATHSHRSVEFCTADNSTAPATVGSHCRLNVTVRGNC